MKDEEVTPQDLSFLSSPYPNHPRQQRVATAKSKDSAGIERFQVAAPLGGE